MSTPPSPTVRDANEAILTAARKNAARVCVELIEARAATLRSRRLVTGADLLHAMAAEIAATFEI